MFVKVTAIIAEKEEPMYINTGNIETAQMKEDKIVLSMVSGSLMTILNVNQVCNILCKAGSESEKRFSVKDEE